MANEQNLDSIMATQKTIKKGGYFDAFLNGVYVGVENFVWTTKFGRPISDLFWTYFLAHTERGRVDSSDSPRPEDVPVLLRGKEGDTIFTGADADWRMEYGLA